MAYSMTRRQFAQLLGGMGVLGMVAPHTLARTFLSDKRALGWLANQTAGAEGNWNLTKVEGKIPANLNGTLVRTAPGTKEQFGTPMKHLFDGDAFVSSFRFEAGKASLQTRFVNTPGRVAEQKAGKMIFSEYGTMAPPPAEGEKRRGGKNQPSVNIIHWDGRLLGLSEGGPPTAIDPKTLEFQSFWDFYGTLPRTVPFTAHPKFDPATGLGYAYGIEQGMSLALKVYRMELNGKLTELYSLGQDGYYMIHDVTLTKNHIVFVIPPVTLDFFKMMAGKSTVAECNRFSDQNPTRIVILRKDGTGKPITIEQPANMVFHHGNAFEKDGKVIVDTVLSPDGSVLDALASWTSEKLLPSTPARLTRLVIDLEKGALVSRTEFDQDLEFPRFDERRTGEDVRYLYTVGNQGNPKEHFVMTALKRHDLRTGKTQVVEAGTGRALGEPVFVPTPGQKGEDQGWLLMQGYDGGKNENFLEIRDAGTLDLAARIWAGNHFPLGFHGNFISK